MNSQSVVRCGAIYTAACICDWAITKGADGFGVMMGGKTVRTYKRAKFATRFVTKVEPKKTPLGT